MQDTKYIQFSFLQKFYRYSFLERGADSGMGGRWKVKHEKGREKETWKAGGRRARTQIWREWRA